MISIYQLKPKFQNLLHPIVKRLYNMKFTANQITLLAMFLSVSVGVLTYYLSNYRKIFFILPIFLFIRMALNAIDGMLAREFNQKSSLGGILNELGDIYSDTAIFLGLWNVIDSHILLILVIIFSIISEVAGILGAVVGKNRRYDGPMGKSDRAFIIGCLGLAFGFGWENQNILNGVFILLILLLNYTTFNRIKNCLKECD